MIAAAHQTMLAPVKVTPPEYWGLCFTAEQAGSTVAMQAVGSAPSVSLETSVDGGSTWSPFAVGTTTITLTNAGDAVYFRAGSGGNQTFATASTAYNRFVLAGRVGASGSVNSLLDAEDTNPQRSQSYLFNSLFADNASLVSAPELPGEHISAQRCYGYMFENCTSLITPPSVLPQPIGYYVTTNTAGMFKNCTSLVTTPEIRFTTYKSRGVNSSMFSGCASLQEIRYSSPVWFTNGYANWVSGVPAQGIFRCPTALGTNETIQRGDNYCPSGWTVINTD